jgi:hypothetical protein
MQAKPKGPAGEYVSLAQRVNVVGHSAVQAAAKAWERLSDSDREHARRFCERATLRMYGVPGRDHWGGWSKSLT